MSKMVNLVNTELEAKNNAEVGAILPPVESILKSIELDPNH